MAKKFLTVKVSGLKELEAALKELDHDLHKKTLKAAGKSAMEPVAQRVRQNVPKDTGGLASTVRTSASTDLRRLRKIGRKASMVASVSAGRASRKHGVTGHQALNIEYGNSKTKAQPFMRPAIQGKEKTVFMHFRRLLRTGIEKSARTQQRRSRRLK
jgi:HK97 gp10 family phage protein